LCQFPTSSFSYPPSSFLAPHTYLEKDDVDTAADDDGEVTSLSPGLFVVDKAFIVLLLPVLPPLASRVLLLGGGPAGAAAPPSASDERDDEDEDSRRLILLPLLLLLLLELPLLLLLPKRRKDDAFLSLTIVLCGVVCARRKARRGIDGAA